MSSPILKLTSVSKSFPQGKGTLDVLRDIYLEIEAGQKVALLGPSGAGKTTLLQIAGLLDVPTVGEVHVCGHACAKERDEKRAAIRKAHIGMVYQLHHLLPDFTALENVMIPQMIAGTSKKQAAIVAKETLRYLGLEDRLKHRSSELSGGQQQRVAIARAMVNRPSLILADEPTGNLDPKTAQEVFDVLLKVTHATGSALLMVTHNTVLAQKMDRRVYLEQGSLVEKVD